MTEVAVRDEWRRLCGNAETALALVASAARELDGSAGEDDHCPASSRVADPERAHCGRHKITGLK